MMATEYTVPAQFVVLACGFNGPERGVYDAFEVETTEGPRVRPVMVGETHQVSMKENKTPKVPVYAAGDARHGSTLVVNSLADGLLCAKEVAADLLQA